MYGFMTFKVPRNKYYLFVRSLRKQFVFQKSRTRLNYKTDLNNESGLPNALYAIMIFLVVSDEFGIDPEWALEELGISSCLSETLFDEWILLHSETSETEKQNLRRRLDVKANLVRNAFRFELLISELPTHGRADGLGFGGHRLT